MLSDEWLAENWCCALGALDRGVPDVVVYRNHQLCLGRKVAGEVHATEAPGAPVSPHEIMVKQGRLLPVEYWADPF